MLCRSVLIAALFVLAGCSGREVDTRPVAGLWSGELSAVGEHGHSGFATGWIQVTGSTQMNVTLSGGAAGGVHPWSVETGPCGEDGSMVGAAGAYPLLRPDDAGNASATVTLDEALDPEGTYHVSIRQSEDDDTVVGCGNLVER